MIYTKSGDNGRSSTFTRTSLAKNSPIFNLLGSLDEFNSNLGLAKVSATEDIAKIIEGIQSDVISASAEIAGGKKFAEKSAIVSLEKAIDEMSTVIPEFNGFVLPGGNEVSARLDVARTVIRRAERSAVEAQQRGGITKDFLAWINRLSDFIYALARFADIKIGKQSSDTLRAGGKALCVEGFCDIAESLCREIRSYAFSKGVKVVVAVCDAGGNTVCVQRQDDAYIASIDIAMNKAYTCASLQMSTKKVGELTTPDASLYGLQYTNNGRIVIFGGGEPLYKDGQLIGGLGVSGGTAEQDTSFAEYGVNYFNKELI